MNNKELRQKVKMLKATDTITNYYELAEILEISKSSIYSWLNNQFDFGYEKMQLLQQVIEDLVIPE